MFFILGWNVFYVKLEQFLVNVRHFIVKLELPNFMLEHFSHEAGTISLNLGVFFCWIQHFLVNVEHFPHGSEIFILS